MRVTQLSLNVSLNLYALAKFITYRSIVLRNSNSDRPQWPLFSPGARHRIILLVDVEDIEVVRAGVRTIPVYLHYRFTADVEIEISLCPGPGVLLTAAGEREGGPGSDDMVLDLVQRDVVVLVRIVVEPAPVDIEVFHGERYVGLVVELELDPLSVAHCC